MRLVTFVASGVERVGAPEVSLRVYRLDTLGLPEPVCGNPADLAGFLRPVGALATQLGP